MGGAPVTAAPQLPAAAMQRANLTQPGVTPAQGAAMGAPGVAPNAVAPNAMGAHTLPGAKNGPPLPQSATAPANAVRAPRIEAKTATINAENRFTTHSVRKASSAANTQDGAIR